MRAVYMDTTSAYQSGYADALGNMRRRQRERKRRRWYFIKQRAAGVVLLLITIIAVVLLDGDATIGVFTVPLALYLIFGSEMVIVNGYYWKTKERAEHEKRGKGRRVRF